MASSTLIAHMGGHLCSLDELNACPTPAPQGRWHPVAHGRVLATVKETLTGAGYGIVKEQLCLARNDQRFFGTLDLAVPLVSGVSLAVGVRNSVDKSFPLGFCAGNRVFICDNLAFRAELLIKRKHTRYGEQRFALAIASAISSLATFREAEESRLRRLQFTDLTDEQASHLILTAFLKGIISAPQLPRVCAEWLNPTFEEFQPRTAWSLLNSFTTVLRPVAVSNPQRFAGQSIRLNALLSTEQGVALAA